MVSQSTPQVVKDSSVTCSLDIGSLNFLTAGQGKRVFLNLVAKYLEVKMPLLLVCLHQV